MDCCELPTPARRREEIGRTPMLGVAFDAATLLVDFRPGVPAHPRVATAAAVDGPQGLLAQLRAHFGAGEIARFTSMRWREGREAFVAQGLLATITDHLRARGMQDAEQRIADAWGRIADGLRCAAGPDSQSRAGGFSADHSEGQIATYGAATAGT